MSSVIKDVLGCVSPVAVMKKDALFKGGSWWSNKYQTFVFGKLNQEDCYAREVLPLKVVKIQSFKFSLPKEYDIKEVR